MTETGVERGHLGTLPGAQGNGKRGAATLLDCAPAVLFQIANRRAVKIGCRSRCYCTAKMNCLGSTAILDGLTLSPSPPASMAAHLIGADLGQGRLGVPRVDPAWGRHARRVLGSSKRGSIWHQRLLHMLDHSLVIYIAAKYAVCRTHDQACRFDTMGQHTADPKPQVPCVAYLTQQDSRSQVPKPLACLLFSMYCSILWLLPVLGQTKHVYGTGIRAQHACPRHAAPCWLRSCI